MLRAVPLVFGLALFVVLVSASSTGWAVPAADELGARDQRPDDDLPSPASGFVHATVLDVAVDAVDTAAARARATCDDRGLGAADPMRRLETLAPIRTVGVYPAIEARWVIELSNAADAARRPDGRIDERRATQIADLAPGWPTAVQLQRALFSQQVDDALAAQDFDRAVTTANQAWLHFDVDEWGRALVERARRARLAYVLVGHDVARASFERALQDVRVLERIAPEFDGESTVDAIVDRFAVVTADQPDLDDANAIQRHVAAWAVAHDTDSAREIAGRAHYVAAADTWQLRRHWIGLRDSRDMREHLDDAYHLGYADDPDRLRPRLFLATTAPFGLPVLFAGLLGMIAFGYSRGLRRRRAARTLAHAERLKASGRSIDAATALLRAWHLTEGLALLERRDQLILARAAEGLLQDAIERGQLADAARWAGQLADLPFELWPDGFEADAKRLGIDVQRRARQTLATPPHP